MRDLNNYKDLVRKVSVLDLANVETLLAQRIDHEFPETVEKLLQLHLALNSCDDLNRVRVDLVVQLNHILRDFGLPF